MGVTGFLRRNWLWAGFAAVLAGLAVNIAAHDGVRPLIVIAAAAAGAGIVLGAVAYLSGAQVVKHARAYETRVLENARRKEISK